MEVYFNGSDAVSDLHKKGFTDDFLLFGNDLLWVQEKIFVRLGEFAILEYCKIIDRQKKSLSFAVFGIIAPYHHIKGILVDHFKAYPAVTPPVLVRKLNELEVRAGSDYAAASAGKRLINL